VSTCVVRNKPYGSSNGLICMAQGQHTGIDPPFRPRPIAGRIRPRESGFHTWDRPTKTPFFYDTGAAGLIPVDSVEVMHMLLLENTCLCQRKI